MASQACRARIVARMRAAPVEARSEASSECRYGYDLQVVERVQGEPGSLRGSMQRPSAIQGCAGSHSRSTSWGSSAQAAASYGFGRKSLSASRFGCAHLQGTFQLPRLASCDEALGKKAVLAMLRCPARRSACPSVRRQTSRRPRAEHACKGAACMVAASDPRAGLRGYPLGRSA